MEVVAVLEVEREEEVVLAEGEAEDGEEEEGEDSVLEEGPHLEQDSLVLCTQ